MWRSLHGITRNRPSLHQPAPLSSSASADPQQRPPPRVVILGAGYAGSLLARELEEDVSAGRIELVVVDRRDHCHHKIGAIRASVRNGEWSERVRIPLNRVLRHPARVVLGEVVAVDPENKVLRFSNDHVAQLRFDILVCSTGALNHSPGDLPASVRTEEQARDYFKDTANAIRDARDIIIVGGEFVCLCPQLYICCLHELTRHLLLGMQVERALLSTPGRSVQCTRISRSR